MDVGVLTERDVGGRVPAPEEEQLDRAGRVAQELALDGDAGLHADADQRDRIRIR